jgi:hypothetical protein
MAADRPDISSLEAIMDSTQFDQITRHLGDATHRRSLLRSAARLGGVIAGLGIFAIPGVAMDSGNSKTLCRPNGSTCKEKGRTCSASNCLRAPFTVEATWSTNDDFDTYLFLPPNPTNSVPSPHVTSWRCNVEDHGCNSDIYPYVCIDQDGDGADTGEATTVHKLLKGTYEYWIYLVLDTPKGDLKVTLRDAHGGVVRTWSSPGNPDTQGYTGWHVFDVDGATGAVKSIDRVPDVGMPSGAHDPTTPVCSTPMEM